MMRSNKRKQATDAETHGAERGLDRFEGFSDAVFAIALTLLIVEIQVPGSPGQDSPCHAWDILYRRPDMYHGRMFPRQPAIQVLPIPGASPCLVIDNFLDDPEMLRDFACRHREQFQNGRHHAYPGPELLMPQDFSAQLDLFFSQHIRRRLGGRRTVNMFSRLAMVTLRPEELSPLQRLCHHDNYADGSGEIFPAMVLYLFDAPELGGTSFYAPKLSEPQIAERQQQWRDMDSARFSAAIGSPPAYMCESNPYFDLLATVPARWNRAIFYDGGLYHSAHITRPELLSPDPRKGRLTLNGFWRCRQGLAGGA